MLCRWVELHQLTFNEWEYTENIHIFIGPVMLPWNCRMSKSCVLFPVDGGWTPWSVWSDCSVTCGRGTQVRTHACINPPPRNNGSDCSGPERETQDCHTPPCLGLFTNVTILFIHSFIHNCLSCLSITKTQIIISRMSPKQDYEVSKYSAHLLWSDWLVLSTDDLCPWSPWSQCSRSCGAGSVSRRRVCVCEAGGDAACPAEIEAERNREETQLCYKQPCPGT